MRKRGQNSMRIYNAEFGEYKMCMLRSERGAIARLFKKSHETARQMIGVLTKEEE